MAFKDGLTVRQVGGDRRRCAAAGGSSDRERPGRRAGGHDARADGTLAAHRRGATYGTQIADVVDGHPIPWPCGFATAAGLRPGH